MIWSVVTMIVSALFSGSVAIAHCLACEAENEKGSRAVFGTLGMLTAIAIAFWAGHIVGGAA